MTTNESLPSRLDRGLRDPWFWGAVMAALALRLLPLLIWGIETDCSRDECIYASISNRLLEGHGLTATRKGWLAAPGYPYLLAACELLFGSQNVIKIIQVVISVASVWLLYRIGARVGGIKVGRVSAWLLALHPTFAFYAGTRWTETFYAFLLLSAVLSLLWARDHGGRWRRALVAGLFLAGCVLFRGVATYLLPVFLLALIWPASPPASWRERWQAMRARWRTGLALLAATVLTIAPYAIYGSTHYGGAMVSDATVGHVIFLGNNTFEPITFDYGNGMLTSEVYGRWLRTGRRPCSRKAPPVRSSKCEVKHAMRFITHQPKLFFSRVPLRLAQLLNPHTFLTRHLRWNLWPGIPWWLKELVIYWTCATSLLIIFGGTVGAFARARGSWGVLAVGTILYHLTVISIMYGMTRFRLPLEPFWMVFLAMVLVDPRGTLSRLRTSPLRALGLALCLPALAVLVAWFFATGFPGYAEVLGFGR